jgi:hypothetical protein
MNSSEVLYQTLLPEDEAALDQDRGFLPAVVETCFPGECLTGTQADLGLMQRVLDSGPYTDDATAEVVALGTALGDVMAATTGMHWVRTSDEDGVDLALRYGDTSIVVFPRSMLLKRLERDESPNLRHLHDQVRASIQDLLAKGEYKVIALRRPAP